MSESTATTPISAGAPSGGMPVLDDASPVSATGSGKNAVGAVNRTMFSNLDGLHLNNVTTCAIAELYRQLYENRVTKNNKKLGVNTIPTSLKSTVSSDVLHFFFIAG